MNWVQITTFILIFYDFCLLAERLPDFEVKNIELEEIANRLRDDDINKAKKGQIVLDYQGHTTTRSEVDNAKNKFFKYVDSALLRQPTYKKFIALNDNYERQTGIIEDETAQEREEIDGFLDAITSTKLWKTLYKFLHQKGHPYAKSERVFRNWITQLWFYKYSRYRGVPDSSGFEHVFIGEVKNNEISGLHNWLRFYLLEKNQSESFDYKGFLIKRYNVMAALKYSWRNELKRTGSFLIGTSPEFDMALYTLCFLSRRGRDTCDIEIDGCPFQITSYDLIQRSKVFIGSIYSTAGRMTEICRLKNAGQ